MAAKLACGCELTEFVSYHIFCNVNRDKFISVVNCDCMSYKIRRNHRSSGPSFYYALLASFIHSKNFLFQRNCDVRTFL